MTPTFSAPCSPRLTSISCSEVTRSPVVGALTDEEEDPIVLSSTWTNAPPSPDPSPSLSPVCLRRPSKPGHSELSVAAASALQPSDPPPPGGTRANAVCQGDGPLAFDPFNSSETHVEVFSFVSSARQEHYVFFNSSYIQRRVRRWVDATRARLSGSVCDGCEAASLKHTRVRTRTAPHGIRTLPEPRRRWSVRRSSAHKHSCRHVQDAAEHPVEGRVALLWAREA